MTERRVGGCPEGECRVGGGGVGRGSEQHWVHAFATVVRVMACGRSEERGRLPARE